MRRMTMLWCLAAINAILLVALTWKLGGVAHAQAGRGRSDYVMVTGNLTNASNGVCYMVDTRNGLLVPFVYDNNARQLISGQPIDLARIMTPPRGK